MSGATRLGLVVAALWVAVAVTRLDDFGPTWDTPGGEYAHGEQYLGYLLTGDHAWLDFSRTPDDLRPPFPRLQHRAPHPDWPGSYFHWFETHPFGGILSAVSCRLVWDGLGWLGAFPAHHLPIVLWVAVLVAVLVRWAASRWGGAAGVAAALSLLLAPRFVADAFNNLKDAPEACLYALALLTYAAALARPRPARFALAGALTGLALAQKFNALFIPFHVLLYWGLASVARRLRGRPAIPFPWVGAALAAAAGCLAWLAVSPMLWTDTLAGAQVFLDYWRKQGLMPFEVERWDGLLSWLWTTPPVLLLLAALGLCRPRLDSDERCLLLLGILLPVGRTLLPGAINFDGVRHFLEFQPFLALAAAAGFAWLLELAAIPWTRERRAWVAAAAASGPRPMGPPPGAPPALAGALLVVLFLTPAAAVVSTWPHGTCYFNAFVGGLAGAQARDVPGATDYWAGSYWQGMAWLDEHAERGASLLVPVAPQVASTAAPVRLRPDLRLLPPLPPADAPPAVLYVMYITRRAFYDAIAHELEEGDPPFHELKVQGGTITRIHRLAEPAAVRRVLDLWRTRDEAALAAHRLYLWTMLQPPEVMTRVMAVMKQVRSRGIDGAPERWRELTALLPEKLHDEARIVLDHDIELPEAEH